MLSHSCLLLTMMEPRHTTTRDWVHAMMGAYGAYVDMEGGIKNEKRTHS